MYGYDRHIDITPEQLLQKINQEEIFKLVLKQEINLESKYYSPFRKDNKPKCFFTYREDGILLFIDFSDRMRHTHRSCFRMLMDSFNPSITLQQAIELICDKFNLSKESSDYKSITVYKANQTDTEEEETIIKYKTRPFNKIDKVHWSKFLITINNLIEDNVFAVQNFTKINAKGRLSINPYSPCYAIDFVNHVKINMPYNKNFAWLTNCDNNDIGNFDNLPPTGKKLLISKAYKDHRVFRNILNTKNVVWFQNESGFPSEYLLKNLLERFTEIIIFFDNDFPGIKAGYRLYKILYFLSKQNNLNNIIKMKYVPIKYSQKDIAEYVHKEGRQDTLKLLKQLNI